MIDILAIKSRQIFQGLRTKFDKNYLIKILTIQTKQIIIHVYRRKILNIKMLEGGKNVEIGAGKILNR